MTRAEEIAEIARQTAEHMQKDKSEFFVAPEDHYNDHQFVKKMQTIFDNVSEIVGKFILKVALVGFVVFVALAVGSKFDAVMKLLK